MKDSSKSKWTADYCRSLEESLASFDENLIAYPFKSKRLTRLLNWEFWPQKFLYIPVYMLDYAVGISILNPVYFAAANPKLTYGGMFSSGKNETALCIPMEHQPPYLLLSSGLNLETKIEMLKDSGIPYPLILKPDIGDRGILVRKCENALESHTYLENADFDVFAQGYISEPLEFGVFCLKRPGNKRFELTSITYKKQMHVQGDGTSSVQELVEKHPRLRLFEHAILQRLSAKTKEYIASDHEVIPVVQFGNHSKGCMFLNANELIDSPLQEAMNELCQKIDDFHYGRFDLRTNSIEDLIHGRFQIIELNGALAEPTHIYEPKTPYLKGIKSLLNHHYILFQIGRFNSKLEKKKPSIRKTLKDLKKFRKYESSLAKRD